MDAITDFVVSWALGMSRGDVASVGGFGALAYALAAVTNGDAGWSVPYLTPWFQTRPKIAKTGIVLGLVTVASAVLACLTGGWALPVAFAGAKAGFAAAFMAIGGNSAMSNWRKRAEPKPPVEAVPPNANSPTEG